MTINTDICTICKLPIDQKDTCYLWQGIVYHSQCWSKVRNQMVYTAKQTVQKMNRIKLEGDKA